MDNKIKYHPGDIWGNAGNKNNHTIRGWNICNLFLWHKSYRHVMSEIFMRSRDNKQHYSLPCFIFSVKKTQHLNYLVCYYGVQQLKLVSDLLYDTLHKWKTQPVILTCAIINTEILKSSHRPTLSNKDKVRSVLVHEKFF